MEQKGKCFDNIVNWLQTQNSAFLNFELILLGVFLRILTFYFKVEFFISSCPKVAQKIAFAG